MADPTPPTIPVTVTNAPVNWPAVLLAIGHMLWPVLIGGALLIVKVGGYTVTGPTPSTPTTTPGAPPDLTTVIGGQSINPGKADPLEWLPLPTADGGVVLVRGHWYPSHEGAQRGVTAFQEDNPHIPNLRSLIEGQP